MDEQYSTVTDRPGYIQAFREEIDGGCRVEVYSGTMLRPHKSGLYSPVWEALGDRCYAESEITVRPDPLMMGMDARSHAFEAYDRCPGDSVTHQCRKGVRKT